MSDDGSGDDTGKGGDLGDDTGKGGDLAVVTASLQDAVINLEETIGGIVWKANELGDFTKAVEKYTSDNFAGLPGKSVSGAEQLIAELRGQVDALRTEISHLMTRSARSSISNYRGVPRGNGRTGGY